MLVHFMTFLCFRDYGGILVVTLARFIESAASVFSIGRFGGRALPYCGFWGHG
jgi:hypothetical protein